MPPARRKPDAEQRFDHLTGLDGISDDQVGEHRSLYAGYIRQVNTLNAELSALREPSRPPVKQTLISVSPAAHVRGLPSEW
jgi:hypothetical protein